MHSWTLIKPVASLKYFALHLNIIQGVLKQLCFSMMIISLPLPAMGYHRLPVVVRKLPKGLQKVIKKRKQILEHPVSPKHYWTMFEHVCQITFKLDIKDKRKKAYSSANDGGQRHPINLKRVFTNFHQWPWRFVSMKGSQITRCYCMWELQGVQEIFSK